MTVGSAQLVTCWPAAVRMSRGFVLAGAIEARLCPHASRTRALDTADDAVRRPPPMRFTPLTACECTVLGSKREMDLGTSGILCDGPGVAKQGQPGGLVRAAGAVGPEAGRLVEPSCPVVGLQHPEG